MSEHFEQSENQTSTLSKSVMSQSNIKIPLSIDEIWRIKNSLCWIETCANKQPAAK